MKKILSISAIFMALMISCTKVDEAGNNSNPLPMPEKAEVSVQGMDITPKNSYVVVGEAVRLEVAFSPADAVVSGNVTWTSSNTAVATVDASGAVTTLGVGIARITASVEGASATAIVNVFAERVPATEIKLNKTEIALLAGRATQVRATLLPDGTGEDGVATTDRLNPEWSSSDESVAIVSYGYIQAKAMGTATITARQGDLTATVAVTVADKIQLQDRSEAWPITDTPKWDKDWSGNISGSHEEVSVSGVDAAYNYMAVMDADKFPGIEALANSVYEQVEEKKDAGQDPASLFDKGETRQMNYSDQGNAIAIVLGYDEEFEFTGEYSQYAFEARTPDPVHATGIQFSAQSGWSYSPVTALEIKEGKSTHVQVSFLPEDCTDTGSITLEAADPSMLKVEAYYPQLYKNQYTVSALTAGTTKLIATFNDVVSELEVTITGSSMTWTDMSSEWTGEWGMGLMYGYYECFGFTLNSCTSAAHLIVVMNASDVTDPATQFKTIASQNEDNLSWSSSSDIPEFSAMSWNDKDAGIERYAFVFGVSSGSYDGKYAIFHYDPNAGGDEPGGEPGTDPVEGKMVSMSNNYFSVTWDDTDKDQDEVTMEGWVYGDSFSGNASGNDGLASMMGVEGVFLIRLQYGKPEVVCDKDANEKKVSSSTALADKEWHHVAATYKRGDKIILYVDGEQVGSTAAPDHEIHLNGIGDGWAGGGLADWHFYIGVSCQTSRDFDGSLAYLRVWDCARSASEIKDNMNVAEPADEGYNLLANWYFNEGSGNTVKDQSGYGYDLTANSDLNWVDGTLPF